MNRGRIDAPSASGFPTRRGSARFRSVAAIVIAAALLLPAAPGRAASPTPGDSGYLVVGWNDLGMHCINPSYKDLVILPPFNNLWAQVVRRGNPPVVVTAGVTLEYSVLNNTTWVGKTDFWQYGAPLFGVTQEGAGLAGFGLSGTMRAEGDHFVARGIPLLPYDDQLVWNPYQAGQVRLKVAGKAPVKKIPVTLPVSDELDCAKCHAAGGDGTMNIGGGTESVDNNILAVHDYYHGSLGVAGTGPDLVSRKPVLCASCHSDNALGAQGDGRSLSLSRAMHGWHAQFPDAGCYDCHPGRLTQCLRTGISGMGYLGETPTCQLGACHGGLKELSDSIDRGRKPWLDEPSCESCHGPNYSTGGVLYRNAKGHGGVYCAACHNSPHAWWPSKLWEDNRQPARLQRSTASIGECSACHTNRLEGHNPHVTYYPASGK
jgi:hypothetical protein